MQPKSKPKIKFYVPSYPYNLKVILYSIFHEGVRTGAHHMKLHMEAFNVFCQKVFDFGAPGISNISYTQSCSPFTYLT